MPIPDDLRRRLTAAYTEALAVGDSPVRADRLAERIAELTGAFVDVEISEDARSRVRSALADAARALRRDDDGREAARHLQTALRWAEDRPLRPPPF